LTVLPGARKLVSAQLEVTMLYRLLVLVLMAGALLWCG